MRCCNVTSAPFELERCGKSNPQGKRKTNPTLVAKHCFASVCRTINKHNYLPRVIRLEREISFITGVITLWHYFEVAQIVDESFRCKHAQGS